MATSAYANIITVTNTNDIGPGSLRQALAVAHDGDRIIFTVSGTIILTSGALVVASNVTISGPGSNHLSIDGNQASLVFGIFPDKTATISDLTIRNGQTGIWNDGGTLTVSNCAVSGNSEGGLFNGGVLTVSNCDVSGNLYGIYNSQYVLTVIHCDISGNSYGIYNYYGEASVSNCIVSSNQYGGVFNYGVSGGPNDQILSGFLAIADSIINDNSGPGVDNNAGGVTIVDTTINGNSVGKTGGQSDVGGGVYTYQYGGKIPGNLTVMNSTISGNFASSAGGGIACGKSGLTIIDSTISGNSAGAYGGGIVGGSFGMMIVNSTVSGNSAATCGGLCGGGVEIGNTILNANESGNIDGTVTSHGYNISSDDAGGLLTGPGDQINTDPLLGPLQDNGGSTFTHALLRGSPAIDAGDPNFNPPPFNDQRGSPFDRVFNSRIDIGSFETQPPRRRPRSTPPPRP
ncbi:MAG: right-handed parallel beta-helix repeat-containing protein [Candidatus Udaeobacter sp.]